APPAPPPSLLADRSTSSGPAERPQGRRRYNALGILEDVPEGEPASSAGGAVAAGAESETDRRGDGDGVATASDSRLQEAPVAAEAATAGEPARRAAVVGLPPQRKALSDADWSNVGRNDPCPCGSGKKFMKCHGVAA